MTPARRWSILLILLAVAGALVLVDSTDETPTATIVEVAPPRPAARQAERQANVIRPKTPTETSMILALRERAPAKKASDSFAAQDWTPPPPPAPKPAPPPPPMAPPLPFKVLGKKNEDGAWQVFLARDDRIFVVRAGDTVENTYLVEAITPPVLTFNYVPLNQRQTLPIGGIE